MGVSLFNLKHFFLLNERFWGCLKSHATIPLLDRSKPREDERAEKTIRQAAALDFIGIFRGPLLGAPSISLSILI